MTDAIAPPDTTDQQAEREARIYAAAGLEGEQVDKWVADHVSWLASWDDHHVEGAVALLHAVEDRRTRDADDDGRRRAARIRELETAVSSIGALVAEFHPTALQTSHEAVDDEHTESDGELERVLTRVEGAHAVLDSIVRGDAA